MIPIYISASTITLDAIPRLPEIHQSYMAGCNIRSELDLWRHIYTHNIINLSGILWILMQWAFSIFDVLYLSVNDISSLCYVANGVGAIELDAI